MLKIIRHDFFAYHLLRFVASRNDNRLILVARQSKARALTANRLKLLLLDLRMMPVEASQLEDGNRLVFSESVNRIATDLYRLAEVQVQL